MIVDGKVELPPRYVAPRPPVMPDLTGKETPRELMDLGFSVHPVKYHGTTYQAAVSISKNGELGKKSGFIVGHGQHGALGGTGVYVTPDRDKASKYAQENGIYAVVMTWDPPDMQFMWDDVKKNKLDNMQLADWTIGSRYNSCVCASGAAGWTSMGDAVHEEIYRNARHVVVRSWQEVHSLMWKGNGYAMNEDGNIVVKPKV
jgi:hypothetical protein